MPLILRCPYCASDRLIRYGVTAKGQQRYRCRACGRPQRENPGSNAYSAAERDTLLCAYAERSSLRGAEPDLWRVAQHGNRLAEKKP